MADQYGPGTGEISDLLEESRSFEPSEEFKRLAYVRDGKVRERSWADPTHFWENAARGLHWFEPWKEVLRWEPGQRTRAQF